VTTFVLLLSRQASIALASDAFTSSVSTQRQRNRPDVIWSHRRQLHISQTQQAKRHGHDPSKLSI
jgi:hypothetical protein